MSEPPPIPPPAAATDGHPPLPVRPATPVRFCRSCGTPWDPAWTECPRCAPTAASGDSVGPAASSPHLASPAAGPLAEYEQDIRSVKSSVMLYMALLLVCLIGAGIANANKGPLSLTGDVVLSSFISGIALAWCAFASAAILPLLRRVAALRWYALGAAGAVVTYALASGAMRLLGAVVDLPTIQYLDPYEAAGVDWRWAIVMICVQPAVFEELAFRGFIQTSLGRVIGPYESVFASALMFGILHCSLPSLPHLLVLGVALGLLRLKTASLYPGMLLHFTHNFLVLLSEHYGRITPW